MQDAFARTRSNALRQIDADVRREDPVLWWFVAVLVALGHPGPTVRLWVCGVMGWLDRGR